MPRLSLSEIYKKLEQGIERTERNITPLAEESGLDVLDLQDVNGRYILLDAYVALAQVRVLLEQQSTPKEVNFWPRSI
jgi:hypothetical protein